MFQNVQQIRIVNPDRLAHLENVLQLVEEAGAAELVEVEEGQCVQMMHLSPLSSISNLLVPMVVPKQPKTGLLLIDVMTIDKIQPRLYP